MCASLGPASLGLSELPGLPGSLFPLPDWGSSPLFFKKVFNFLVFLFSFCHPCDSDVGMFKVVLEVPEPLLMFLNSCFFILFWLNVYLFLLLQIVDMSPSFLPFTVGSLYILLYFTCITFTSSSILWAYSAISVSILTTNVLNSASDSLAISLSLSSILELWSVLSFGPYFFSQHAYYVLRGRALGIRQGGATHITALWRCMWGRDLRENSKVLQL